MIRINCIAGAICLLFLMTFCIGCFDTPYSLGPAGDAKVNRAYIGDFTQVTDKDKSTLIIRNIDDKQYYVEITSPGDKTPARFVGYTADVKGVTFAHLTMMQDDGGINAKHFIERIGISDDGTTLTLRSLNDKFFADKNIDSNEALKKVIAANLDNADMYDGDPDTLTRVPADKPQDPGKNQQ